MLERVDVGEGLLSIAELHGDYVRWCQAVHVVPYNKDTFAERFTALAEELSLAVTCRRGKAFYSNLVLLGAEREPAVVNGVGKRS